MSEPIESLIKSMKQIVVNTPFESTVSQDVPADALRILRSVIVLTKNERSELDEQFTREFGDFQKRSMLARVATLCEAFFDTSNSDYIAAAIFLYDSACKFVDWRECRINLAIILHSLNSLDAKERELVLKTALNSFHRFSFDYTEAIGEDKDHFALSYFSIELKATARGHRFQPQRKRT